MKPRVAAGGLVLFVATVAALVELSRLAIETYPVFPTLWISLHSRYALNFWSEPAIYVQVSRIASGVPPYRPVYWEDSWTYGPFYPYFMATIDRLFERQPSITTLRLISTWLGAMTVIPLIMAVIGLRRHGRGGMAWMTTTIASVLTLVSFVLLESRSINVTGLHPDVVTFACLALAANCLVWVRVIRNPPAGLTLLALLCLAMTLSKFNTAPLFAFLVAALVVGRRISWRVGLIWILGFVLTVCFVIILEPGPVRAWTLLVPAHHRYLMPSTVIGTIWREWTVAQPYQGLLACAAVTTLIFWALTKRTRQAAQWGLALAGTFAAGYQALAKEEGGPNDLWLFYVLTLIPIGAFIDELLRSYRGRIWRALVASSVALAYIALLQVLAVMGVYAHTPLPEYATQANALTAGRLAALCRPGVKIIATWFIDPFVHCQGALLPTWPAIDEVALARIHGYTAPVFLDHPLSPDILIFEKSHPLAAVPVGTYNETDLPFWDGFAYGYTPRVLVVLTRNGISSP